MILQTLQQLRDVYGESVDKIVQGNTSNIVFLKSTDDSMLQTLEKMSGTTHQTYADSKTITQDVKSLIKMTATEGKQSITMTTKEEPVIKYNDMAFIEERNSIVFRAGDSPIWNKNQTILPMSWRLFKTTITQPGKEYTLQTIPTLSTAMDFDVRKNQPNFSKMLEKRMKQAELAGQAQKSYQEAYGYTDYQVEQLDPDNYSDEIMDLICSTLNPEETKQAVEASIAGGQKGQVLADGEYEEMFDHIFGNQDTKTGRKFTDVKLGIYDEFSTITANKEQESATLQIQQQQDDAAIKRYAGKTVSRDMLVSPMGVSHGLDNAIIRVYQAMKRDMDDDPYFTIRGKNLCGARDGCVYLQDVTDKVAADLRRASEAAKDPNSRVYDEEENPDDPGAKQDRLEGSYVVTDDFLRFLASFPKAWPFVNGEFDARMKEEMMGGETDDEFNRRVSREMQGVSAS